MRLRQELTGDIPLLQQTLADVIPSGQTSLVDGTYGAIALAGSDVGRSLLIVFSDGVDTASFLSPDVVLQSARRSDVVVYGVAMREPHQPDVSEGARRADGRFRIRDRIDERSVADLPSNPGGISPALPSELLASWRLANRMAPARCSRQRTSSNRQRPRRISSRAINESQRAKVKGQRQVVIVVKWESHVCARDKSSFRSLTYYWRTNVAVVLGVATAVSVLAGALLVGDSVRGSLRDLLLGRLGRTDQVVASTSLFREQLAQDLAAQPEFKASFSAVTPLLIVQGMVTAQNEGRRMAQARVYGVDDRFWRFHGVAGVTGPENRDALLSPALARQIGSRRWRLDSRACAAADGCSARVAARATRQPGTFAAADRRECSAGRFARRVLARSATGRSGRRVCAAHQTSAGPGDPGRVNTLLVSTGLSPPADAAAALRALVRRERSSTILATWWRPSIHQACSCRLRRRPPR